MDGILIINKPAGFTSHDVVNVLRKELNIKKIGHTGTLDPNATGVLPILIGQATKVSKYLIEHDKEYVAELKLGIKTSTGDLEGEIIEEKEFPNLNIEEIKKTLRLFLGKHEQIPPIYSAIKINGKKAYEYARNNEQINLEPRKIEIYNIDLLNFENDIIKFKVKCSKGTYIRVLCEDIAVKLGTVGTMQSLCRTKVDKFNIEDSITIGEIKEKGTEFVEKNLILIEDAFSNLQTIKLNTRKTELFLNGVKLSVESEDGVYRVYNSSNFLGLGIIEHKLLKRDVIV